MQTFAVEPEHPFVALWHSNFRDATMAWVRQNLTWVSVDVLRRGYSDIATDCSISIIVTVQPGTLTSSMTLAADKLWENFRSSGLEFNIELREGIIRRMHLQNLFQNPPPIGKSIGPRDTDISGTSGGYVRISKPGKPGITCALTCHHVVLPNKQGKYEIFH
jgi:hypothetical protein